MPLVQELGTFTVLLDSTSLGFRISQKLGASGGAFFSVRPGADPCRRSTDERCCELLQLHRSCRCRLSVVYELHVYQFGSLEEEMLVLGMFVTDFKSTLASMTNVTLRTGGGPPWQHFQRGNVIDFTSTLSSMTIVVLRTGSGPRRQRFQL